MGFDITAWSDYGVAMVGGAAALTGLLFVAVSFNSAWFSSSTAHRGRAGQALVLFVVPLVTGILMLIPGQTPRRLVSRSPGSASSSAARFSCSAARNSTTNHEPSSSSTAHLPVS